MRTTKKRLSYIHRIAWLSILPQFIWQCVFGWFPLLVAFFVAFQKFHVIKPCTFVGWENFRQALNDPLFYITFRNTFYYTFLSIGLTFLIPIIVAILIFEMRKGIIRVMMLLWFIPISAMASNVLWKWWYDPNMGLFNGILTALGFPTLRWLNDRSLAMICLVLPGVIFFAPGLIYLASIQSIPQELYEAADLEGASFWGKIWHITLPRLRPIIAMMLLLSIIGNMQVFDRPFVMTGGGPGHVTLSVVMEIYLLSFGDLRFGKATVLALFLFSILMVLIYLQRRYFKENLDQ